MSEMKSELYKQAIAEALSKRFDSIAEGYTGEITHSEKHKLAMRAIVYGKVEDISVKKTKRLKSSHIIAIIIAAALLLTSCGIIFRRQISKIFREHYVVLHFGEDGSYGKLREEVYILTYLPEGYSLKSEIINKVTVRYRYTNENDEFIEFEQDSIAGISCLDTENSSSEIINILGYDIYHNRSELYDYYLYSDGKYRIIFRTSIELSNEELCALIEGIAIKQ